MINKPTNFNKTNFLQPIIGDSSLIISELLWGGVHSRRLFYSRSDRASAALLTPAHPTGGNTRSVF